MSAPQEQVKYFLMRAVSRLCIETEILTSYSLHAPHHERTGFTVSSWRRPVVVSIQSSFYCHALPHNDRNILPLIMCTSLSNRLYLLVFLKFHWPLMSEQLRVQRSAQKRLSGYRPHSFLHLLFQFKQISLRLCCLTGFKWLIPLLLILDLSAITHPPTGQETLTPSTHFSVAFHLARWCLL